MRNPKWHREEIVLALNLYFKLEPGQIHARNPEIIELSEVLNKLHIHETRPDKVKFRNPNGVSLKLSNFLAIDPDYQGKGMESYSKLDQEIFFEFYNDRQGLVRIAEGIKQAVYDSSNSLIENHVEDDENEAFYSVREGKVIYKLHKHIERNQEINKKKKEISLKQNGKLECEVCGFDFEKNYGVLGAGFIECHHKKPLFELTEETETTLDDLALICSNCHRMVHRDLYTLSVESLKEIINSL